MYDANVILTLSPLEQLFQLPACLQTQMMMKVYLTMYTVYPYNQDLGSKVISSYLDTDGEGEEEEGGGGGGGGGGEVVTYETEFDLNKYIQRYIEIHITSQTSNLIGPEFIHGVTVYCLLEFLLLCITS